MTSCKGEVRPPLRALWAVIVLICACSPLHASVTFDTTSNGSASWNNATTQTLNVSHTTNTGPQGLMLVGVALDLSGSSTAQVTGVTYGTQSLTLVGAQNVGTNERVEIWALTAPATGRRNVTITASIPGRGHVGVVAGVVTFDNVDQTNPTGNFTANSGTTGRNPSVAVNSSTGDYVFDVLATPRTVTQTVAGTQTAEWTSVQSGTSNTADVRSSGGILAGATSVAPSWTLSGNSAWIIGAVNINAAASADISIAGIATPDLVNINGTLTFNYTVSNAGPDPATNVNYSLTLPAGQTLVSANSSAGSCTGTGPIACSLGTIAANASATVTITVTETAAGGVTQTPSVAASENDPDTSDNSITVSAVAQNPVCANPGQDGPGGTLSGIVNTYFPPRANGTVASGATSVALGAGTGATTPIGVGDLLVIIQMQDAAVDSDNDQRYGSGAGTAGVMTGAGAGYTNLNNAGRYEFIVAANALPITGGTLNFTAAGAGGGLLYTYTEAAPTATQGARRYQVIRVPQYSSATLSSGLTASTWTINTTTTMGTGGVLALDIAGTLTLGGTVSVDGLGFHGGAGRTLAGGTGNASDYITLATTNVNAPKGEGVAGTPRYIFNSATLTTINTGVEGLPNGSMARGAPSNAGGGGTDADPAANDENSGGGGGSNGGAGGQGGYAWNTGTADGGFGAVAFPGSTTRATFGGGGGAGTTNNGTTESISDPTGTGIASSGGAGGGMVLIRAANVTGTGTITANGLSGYNTANDGAGGGGAGGTIIVLSQYGSLAGLTVQAHGGAGGSAWLSSTKGTCPNSPPWGSGCNYHGPGGGGGGGLILLSDTPASIDVSGGANGLTTQALFADGATSGTSGISNTSTSISQTPGIRSGSTCAPDLSITKSHFGTFIRGGSCSFTLAVSNIGVQSTDSLVTVADNFPVGLVPTGASGTGWSCSVVSQAVSCSRSDALAGSTSYPSITVNGTVAQAASASVINSATTSGGGEFYTDNDTATDTAPVISVADVSAASSGAPTTVAPGANITYTQQVSNAGPSDAINAVFTSVLDANSNFQSISVPTGWTCTTPSIGSTGTITCNASDFAAGTATFIIVAQVNAGTASGTVLTDNASVSSAVTDPNSSNNSAITSVTVSAQSDVGVTLSASSSSIKVGDSITYTIVASNAGPSTATNVNVVNNLPSDLQFTSVTSTAGSCTFSSGTLNCAIGSLASGANATITLMATAVSTNLDTDTASISADQPDPNSADNSASVTTLIVAPTEVKLVSFDAYSTGGAVVLAWKTRAEVRNLGFNVYRESSGGRVKLTPSLIAGQALRVGNSLVQHTPGTYSWTDNAPVSGSVYWLEDVDVNGTVTTHGPVQPSIVSSLPRLRAQVSREVLRPGSPLARAGFQSPGSSVLLSELRNTGREIPSHALPAVPAEDGNQVPLPVAGRSRGGSAPANSNIPVNPEASKADIKIGIKQAGWYQISQRDLTSAGLPKSASLDSLHLYSEGSEVPMEVDNHAGTIAFYGTGIDTPSTDTRIYWLGSGAGSRLPVSSAGDGSLPSANSFPSTVERHDQTVFFAALTTNGNNSNFFGDIVTGAGATEHLTLSNLDPSAPSNASLQVTLQGVTAQVNHSVEIAVNGVSIGRDDFTGMTEGTISLQIPQNILKEGDNVVSLTPVGGDQDTSLVDFVRITYWREYVAENDELNFTVPGRTTVKVKGFTSPSIKVIQLTGTGATAEIEPKIARQPDSTYTIAFENAGSSSASFYAVASSAFLQPASIALNVPGSLSAKTNAADLLIITPSDFASALPPLVALRQQQGIKTMVVDVEDVFDEFNYGERSPDAIRNFLALASKTWKEAPRFLLLVGDASIDPRNLLGMGSFDFVPTELVSTASMKTASDSWFSEFNNDGLPQIATGRLPVRTLAEATSVISKIVQYEQQSLGPWAKNALLVADSNVGADFETETAQIQSQLPSNLTATKVLVGQTGFTNAHTSVINALNSGQLLVNYLGHGSVDVWTNIFGDADADALTNGSKTPFVISMDCLNGYFQDVYQTSMATSLLLAPNGGAAAVWASSGLTDADPQFVMDKTLVGYLFANSSITLGEATTRAKAAISDLDVRRTYNLFGDPTMKLRHVK